MGARLLPAARRLRQAPVSLRPRRAGDPPPVAIPVRAAGREEGGQRAAAVGCMVSDSASPASPRPDRRQVGAGRTVLTRRAATGAGEELTAARPGLPRCRCPEGPPLPRPGGR